MIHVLYNPQAGSAAQLVELRERAREQENVRWEELRRGEEAREQVAQAVQQGATVIAAAGGDGTVNAVINALAPDFEHVRFGIVPLGTGNDLARTLGVPDDPAAALALLTAGEERRLDLVYVESAGRSLYCANVASGGFAGQLQESMTPELKGAWGPLAYLLGVAMVLPDLKDYQTTIRLDDIAVEDVVALNIIVANGRTAAGGRRVAGRANPEDGLLDVVIVRYGPLLDLAVVAAQLLAGDYTDSEQVVYRRARRIEIDATPDMSFSVDGDVFTRDPATFTIRPGVLRAVVGPEYRAQPAA